MAMQTMASTLDYYRATRTTSMDLSYRSWFRFKTDIIIIIIII